VVRYSSGDSDVRDRPRSRLPCTAVSSSNEKRLDQLIRTNPRITTRGLCMELNVRFNALETLLETSEYRKICARLVPRMFTQEYTDHQMLVSQYLRSLAGLSC
jgi:hypothetical protein